MWQKLESEEYKFIIVVFKILNENKYCNTFVRWGNHHNTVYIEICIMLDLLIKQADFDSMFNNRPVVGGSHG